MTIALLLLGCSLTSLSGDVPPTLTPTLALNDESSPAPEASPTMGPPIDAATAVPLYTPRREIDCSLRDCGASTEDAAPAEGSTGAAPLSSEGTYWVRNPTSGVNLFVQVVRPAGWDGTTPLPALVLVPGGSGAGSSSLVEKEGKGS